MRWNNKVNTTITTQSKMKTYVNNKNPTKMKKKKKL